MPYDSYGLRFAGQSYSTPTAWKEPLTATPLNLPPRQGLQSKE